MRAQNASILFTGLIIALLVANFPILVQAQSPPPLPMLYTGNITLNGSPAPDGLNVTALDSGVVVGSALTSGGAYSLSACSPENCNQGDTLSFKLNGQLTAAQTVAVDTSQRGIPQNQDLAFTGTLSSVTTTAPPPTSTTVATTQQTTSTSQATTSSSVASTSSAVSSTSSTESSVSMSESSSATVPATTSNSTALPTGPKCLIATATYGSELAPEVQLLRNFRDYSIMKTQAGSNFMVAFNAWYYSFSPYVANYIANHWVERTIMKGVLYPLIGMLFLTNAVFTAAAPYPEFAALLSGLIASSLIGAFYLGLPIGFLRARVRRLRNWKGERLFEQSFGLALLSGMILLIAGEATALPALLMVSSAAIVLSTLFLSALLTSAKIGKRLHPA